jgi:glycine cleavage system regulatory protein
MMDMKDELGTTLERLAVAAGLLEQAVERLGQTQSALSEDAEATISRIVATVESRREAELEEKLAAAESRIAELQARESASSSVSGRKTLTSSMTSLLAKQGLTLDSLEAGTLDAALVSLSLEQRIAVKAQLMRAGLLG